MSYVYVMRYESVLERVYSQVSSTSNKNVNEYFERIMNKYELGLRGT